jgi:peptidoglycan/xylan/chitin deacetylase (PgdA/CDA1 family)
MSSGASLRWYAKKAARRCVALAPFRGSQPRVHVLTYHRFVDAPYDPFSVPPTTFERQMRWLREEGRAVSLHDVQEYLQGRSTLRDGSVLVTIDDGEPCLYERALPILERHSIPAIAFVPAGELGGRGAPERSDRMSWAQLREASERGLTIGSHAWTHRSLGGRSAAEVGHEIRRSREALEDALGVPVTAFAYPFGTRKDYGADAAAALRKHGFACGFTSQHGALVPGADPYELPRVKIEGGDPAYVFERACSGGLDAWRWVDRTLWRLQAAS